MTTHFLEKKSIKTGAYFLISLLLVLSACNKKPEEKEETALITLEKQYKTYLETAATYLDSIQNAANAQEAAPFLLASRRYFKKNEPLLSFVDNDNYKYLNQPNILKVEEEDLTDIKIKEPTGYQVLEEEIFAEEPDITVIQKHAKLVSNRLRLLHQNTSFLYLKDHHILWVIRDAIMSVALTGITGFDSPVLENSLEEAKIVYESLGDYLDIYQKRFQDTTLYNQWKNEVNASINVLKGDFNTFNRYAFIKEHTHKAMQIWQETVTDWGVEFPFHRAIKNDAVSLFTESTFNPAFFSHIKPDSLEKQKAALGKLLFHEKGLSTDNVMSCATCHQPELAFTDGKKIAIGNTRNTPTLTYAALQRGFFYDMRSGSLEGQIISVVENENEFHSDLGFIQKAVNKNQEYVTAFKELYPSGATHDNIRNAIATYIRALSPFNSRFDKGINGTLELTEREINGFNLFMGKAKCATCHFPPLFNGTVPVAYRESEMEAIGVPSKNDTLNAVIDADKGRYNLFKTPEREFFFKTSTVRNVALTAPYMHNGVYTTLEEVIDFYNRGGGQGIGIPLEGQTLPPDPLGLDTEEVNDLIAFMEALNDENTAKNP
ncbi:cytochrome-c peroxidase [Ascidiimonas aurantiaca]|uniref:cytochrome-c peroxidase n=1 Tax=Ascidiimonas aurantiaca TaxID=1685432 RepID=UPI0030EF9078